MKHLNSFVSYCRQRNVKLTAKAYLVDALGAMALGLFASLLMGTIFQTLGQRLDLPLFVQVGDYGRQAMGAAIAVAVASRLGASGLLLFGSVAVGMVGAQQGGPVGAYLAAVAAVEVGKLVQGQTKVDILLTPATCLFVGTGVAFLLGGPLSELMLLLGRIVQQATLLQPLLMGSLVAVIVGMLLTLPVSSAAICIAIGLGGLAGGAATAGCCAQMVGFAVMSFPDNGWGGLAAQGLGTSMLQMPNILRKPLLWLPPILTSALTGPLSTVVFELENIPIGSGMGTCGLVGPIGIYTAMPEGGWSLWMGLFLICFLLPALLCWGMGAYMRRKGWIRPGDLRIAH